MSQMKRCTKCGNQKELAQFHRDHRANDGRRAQCSECSATQKRTYRANHRDILNAQNRARRAELNAVTQKAATRTGVPWTADEDEYLATTTDNTVWAALNLERTYGSVQSRRARLRRRAAQGN